MVPTHTGRHIDVLKLKTSDIDIRDIAFALSYINRYNGWIGACSVGYHSILVSTLLPVELQLHGLLHDASEAYIQDIVCMTKGRLRICPTHKYMSFKKYENSITRTIYRGLKLELPTTSDKETISRVDKLAVRLESQQPVSFYEKEENRPGAVAERFLARYQQLYENNHPVPTR